MSQLGQYTIVRELARGGMGVVYVAQDPVGREVALKLLLEAHDPSERRRFLREAEALGRIEHPHVVRVHQFGQDAQGRDFLVLGLVEGESLQDRLQRVGPLEVEEAARLTRALADALAAAHAAGVLHRDVKPSNVLLRAHDGSPVLTDFGLARVTDQSQRLTQTGVPHGTPAYMPPEQAAGELDRLGPASDVYGLGATLFHLLSGQPPFTGSSPINVLKAVLFQDAPAVSRLRSVPRGLEAIVSRCLAKDPEQRYPSAAALRDALDAYLAGERVPGARRGVGRWLAAGAALLVAVALGVARLQGAPAVEPAAPASRTATAASPPASPPAPAPPRAARVELPSWRGRAPLDVGLRYLEDGWLLAWAFHTDLGSQASLFDPDLQPVQRWTFSGQRVHGAASAGGRVVLNLGLNQSLPQRPGTQLVALTRDGGRRTIWRAPDRRSFCSAIALDRAGAQLALGLWRDSGTPQAEPLGIRVHRLTDAELDAGRALPRHHRSPIHGLAFDGRGHLFAVSGRPTMAQLSNAHRLVEYDPAGKARSAVENGAQLQALAVDDERAVCGDSLQSVIVVPRGGEPVWLKAEGVRGAYGQLNANRIGAAGSVHALRLSGPWLFVRTWADVPQSPQKEAAMTELRVWNVAERAVRGGVTAFANLNAFDVSPDGGRVALGLRRPEGSTAVEVWPAAWLTSSLRTRARWLKRAGRGG